MCFVILALSCLKPIYGVKTKSQMLCYVKINFTLSCTINHKIRKFLQMTTRKQRIKM